MCLNNFSSVRNLLQSSYLRKQSSNIAVTLLIKYAHAITKSE